MPDAAPLEYEDDDSVSESDSAESSSEEADAAEQFALMSQYIARLEADNTALRQRYSE